VRHATPTLRHIASSEPNELVEQARTGEWAEFAPLGPHSISATHEDWREGLKHYESVYQLTEYVDDLGARVDRLENLTRLNLGFNDLGYSDVEHLALLTNLTSLDLFNPKFLWQISSYSELRH